jgi:hypothetical protein
MFIFNTVAKYNRRSNRALIVTITTSGEAETVPSAEAVVPITMNLLLT